MGTFLSCGQCGCVARSFELRCPECAAPLRSKTGSIQRSTAAVMLGLTTLASGTIACGAKVVFVTDDGAEGGSGASSSPGEGGDPSTSNVGAGGFGEGGTFFAVGGSDQGGSSSTGEAGFTPVYGIAGTGGSGGEPL